MPRSKQSVIVDAERRVSERPLGASVVGEGSDNECGHDVGVDVRVGRSSADKGADALVACVDDSRADDVANVGQSVPVLFEDPKQWFGGVKLGEEPPPEIHEGVERLRVCGCVDVGKTLIEPMQVRGDRGLKQCLLRGEVPVERTSAWLQPDGRLDVADGRLAEAALSEQADAGVEEAVPSGGCGFCNHPIIIHNRMITVTLLGVGLLLAYIVGIGVFERVAPRRWVRAYQRSANRLFRPLSGRAHGFAVIETTGRRSGLPRHTPVGGRLQGDVFWLVAGDAGHSDYVKNIAANARVRVQVHGTWRTGRAVIVHEDNARRRLLKLNPINSTFIAVAARDPRTIRIDLD
jgi:deazaflavin-dependent oxidoreductase (nitroreductase family)